MHSSPLSNKNAMLIHMPCSLALSYECRITRDRLGKYSGAVEDFSAAILLDSQNADFYHNRGFSQRKQVLTRPSGGMGACTACQLPCSNLRSHGAYDMHRILTPAEGRGALRRQWLTTALPSRSTRLTTERTTTGHSRTTGSRATIWRHARALPTNHDVATRHLFSMALSRCARLQVSDYTQALNIQPGNATAYHNRGARRS